MFDSLMIKKCRKHLASLYKEKKRLNEKLYDLEEKMGCLGCESYNHGKVSSLTKRYEKCENCEEKKRVIEVASAIDDYIKKIDLYIETDYAKTVFDMYNKKNKKLFEVYDKKYVTWDEVFGDDFNSISKTLRHALVSLIEGDGRYIFK